MERKTYKKLLESNLINCVIVGSQKICDFKYPCSNHSICHPIELTFKPGDYIFELYGASAGVFTKNGGIGQVTSLLKNDNYRECVYSDEEIVAKWKGNARCRTNGSNPGAGGYTKAKLRLNHDVKAFLRIGGQGSNSLEYPIDGFGRSMDKDKRPSPGFNGAGKTGLYTESSGINDNVPGGGGGTDIRFEVDDEFHRTIVAGGGGGADDSSGKDGYGGAGGGLIAQGFWVEGVYKNDHVATQTNGFSFYQGESAIEGVSSATNIGEISIGDKPSGGGGWFGGYSSQHFNGGAGGGSSFVLTKNAIIPEGDIILYDGYYTESRRAKYAYDNKSEFCLRDEEMIQGIWEGNGMIRISFQEIITPQRKRKNKKDSSFYFLHVLHFILGY